MSIKGRMENKLWHIHTKEYSTAMKKKEWLIYAATWITLPHIMVNERSQTQRVHAVDGVQEEVKISNGDGTQNSGYCCGGWRRRGLLTREGHKGDSWCAGSILDLDLSGGHTV